MNARREVITGPRRVVITGVGVTAPDGIGAKSFWSLLSEGRTATRGITFFDPSAFRSRVAAEIDFDPEAHGLSPQEIRRMDRAAQLAVVTTREAVADSGLDLTALDPYRTGVTIGSAVGATMGLDEEYRVVSDGGRLQPRGPHLRCPAPLQLPGAQLLRRRGRLGGRGRGCRDRRLDRLHLGHRRGGAGGGADP